MSGISKKLHVPYYSQPTATTCQATVLRMFAEYLSKTYPTMETGREWASIAAIKKEINSSPGRPNTKLKNAHSNMKWWLEEAFPELMFAYETVSDEITATEKFVGYINAGSPVLASVSHARVPGHIILVVGYENWSPNSSSEDFALVVNDPYGRFDPLLRSEMFGKRRFEGGSSLAEGGQHAPGKEVRLPVLSVGRHRAKDKNNGTYYLIGVRGKRPPNRSEELPDTSFFPKGIFSF